MPGRKENQHVGQGKSSLQPFEHVMKWLFRLMNMNLEKFSHGWILTETDAVVKNRNTD
jgi:hypothetical protein